MRKLFNLFGFMDEIHREEISAIDGVYLLPKIAHERFELRHILQNVFLILFQDRVRVDIRPSSIVIGKIGSARFGKSWLGCGWPCLASIWRTRYYPWLLRGPQSAGSQSGKPSEECPAAIGHGVLPVPVPPGTASRKVIGGGTDAILPFHIL